jgi:branched-chain amino acid transport system substrate-binding protein
MKRDFELAAPFCVVRSLEKFGADLRIARLKRSLTAEQMADCIQVHRSTYGRMERGDPAVAIGLYAKALYSLGVETPFHDLIDPRNDEEGQLLDLQRLPARVRARKARPIQFRLRNFPAPEHQREGHVLRIGVLGVMSGPAAAWGLVSKHCAQTTAQMYNDKGGVDIGGERYWIEIETYDDRMDPARSAEGARHLIEQGGVRYIIGPNVEQTIAAATPVAERSRAMLFPYSFTRSLYRPPRENAVLCQIAGYQAVPRIYEYLIEHEGVETISIVAPATPEGLRQRGEIVSIARALGLRVLSEGNTYLSGADNIETSLTPALATMPDLLALPNLAPSDSTRLIARARDLGFKGRIATESAQDIDLLLSTIGDVADGLVMLGGASPIERRSERMNEFVGRYIRSAGSWNDEAGTKVHTLEMILATLQMAGKSAIDNIDRFKAMIPHISIDNPMSRRRSMLAYYGAKDLRQKRQIGIPLVVNTIHRGQLETLFVHDADEFMI